MREVFGGNKFSKPIRTLCSSDRLLEHLMQIYSDFFNEFWTTHKRLKVKNPSHFRSLKFAIPTKINS